MRVGEGAEIYFPMVPGDSRYLSLMVRAGSNEAAVLERMRPVFGISTRTCRFSKRRR